MSKIIFITGASKGFGKRWAEAFLKRGDKVIATARNIEALRELVEKYGDAVLPLQLDVTDREACFTAVAKGKANFGRIDVLINNAGFGLFGAIEEATEAQVRSLMDANFFGLLWLTQAIIPVMREQQNGHIIQISSYLGLVTLPMLGIYNATKFAVEGLSESLSSQVKGFGIKVTLIEPNGFLTDWAGSSAETTTPIAVYDGLRQASKERAETPGYKGDPDATVKPMLLIIDHPNPPLRLLMGKIAYPAVKENYEQRLASFAAWKDVSDAAHGSFSMPE
ncbi:SDR family NAD(P)-dependent oxidoreductase [Mucilaginibacter polytrichastri]|uniref:Uncharacterized protein n=1 Tax=Mucilaginibacter polytrichastri TaxID=1302689 RepID=A0A1Q5ZY52_9SPHI|nr:SDR family NAD(P)-dependent oxidoreductase [Mucilaginibacter polytrichastri]OKS86704.1 hypothetical protein RG47T_2161 [Mucilaginibacter polytrichastri]SFS82412.1 NADP-dependent 3-hydroxy acid dehydrogenase YdfG [Mucilaginibacter polytrichastri]